MTKITTPTEEIELAPISDEEILKQLIDWMEDRVAISTGFIPDEDTGVLTHQILQITCGEYTTVSNPEPLAIPLRPVGGDELDVTIN